ncbi:DUF1203 domain-containing protein [Cucumibacter marinus]|uniref:DUF1203 domain-containing protein n=1 Tax=Cucumibacter marinus TaxID=1121252 RepID=UPI0004145331|nr:DUF1203 domain-containing protein [Cucumibacter marinus]
MSLSYSGMPTQRAQTLWAGGTDDNDQPPERVTAPERMPCRHCLGYVEPGEDALILGYRPFESLQPYAETGPIFLHAELCVAYDREAGLPPRTLHADLVLLKGYSRRDRIVYGLGALVPPSEIETRATVMLADPRVAYVHMRSATNNCFTLRIDMKDAQKT